MKVTFPHMGTLYIPIKCLLESLGAEVIVPPKISKKTLTIGVQHSPEFACLPLKFNIGNFIEAFEMGAQAVIMAGGVGPCRFGFYGIVEQEILRDLGYDFEMIILEPPRGKMNELVAKLKKIVPGITLKSAFHAIKFTWSKIKAMDSLEKESNRLRPYQIEPGSVSRSLDNALEWIDKAASVNEVEEAYKNGLEALRAVPIDRNRDPIKIGLVGEVYVILEPYANLQVERRLGELGAYVERTIYIGEWISEHLFLDSLRLKGGKQVKSLAKPYINHFVGGHGVETVGNTVDFGKKGYDGVIQVLPLTCMPEIVAQSVLPQVSKDYNIPTMSLTVDEHTGEAGIQTRLEAFTDMLSRRRRMIVD